MCIATFYCPTLRHCLMRDDLLGGGACWHIPSMCTEWHISLRRTQPSHLLFHLCHPPQTILQNLEHPPLLKDASWTLAAPKKEERFHRSPSESIANNFSPAASNLKMRQLTRRKSSCIRPLHGVALARSRHLHVRVHS